MDGGGRVGYEYNYQFWLGDDDVVSALPHVFTLFPGIKNYLLDIRTDFVLKTLGGEEEEDEILDSEVWSARTSSEDNANGSLAYFFTAYRLKEYWMTEDEIDRLARDAFGFAKQTKAFGVDPAKSFITVAVGIRVCTVQQLGEAIEETRARAIRAKHLIPLYLRPFTPESMTKYPHLMIFLHQIPRIRVVNVDYDDVLTMMKICSLCSMKPCIGAQISRLKCGHVFHSHCIVRWLEYHELCPSCDFRVHDRLPR